MEDQDDLDILASLADSDFELQDDDGLEEALCSSNVSPNTTSKPTTDQLTQSQIGQPSAETPGTAPGATVEQMAAQMAVMQEYIKKLEAERNSLQQPSMNDIKLQDSMKESQQSTSTSTQIYKNNTSKKLETSHNMLFSKDDKRLAHTSSQCRSQPESRTSSSSTAKQQSTEHLLIGTKKSNLEPRGQQKDTVRDQGLSVKHGTEGLVTRTKKLTDDDKFLSEKYSGLRIINPLVSSVVMERRMEGRKMVKVSQIPTKIKGKDDIDGDWVTVGVVVQKLPPKKSSNGKTYGIWKLSDLGANSTNELIALFLFGDVYKEHWKTTEGSVVALLNATLLPAKEKNSKDLALTLDNAKKLMLMGISKDLGKCREVRKSDGRPCGNFVNKQHGEFCEYHVQTAYKKMKAQRMEFQAGYAPSAKAPLMKKFQKDLDSSTFMYQGRTVSATARATDQKKKNVTLKSLGIGSKNVADAGNSGDKQGKGNSAAPSEFLVDLLTLPTVGTRNLVKHLNQDEEQKKPVEERQPTLSASDLLKAHEKQVKGGKNSQSQSTSLNPVQNSRQATPMLGRGLDPGSDIFFEESPNIKKRKSSNADRAKLRAISLVKQKGPIEKEDPNAVRKKLSPKAMEQIEKKATCEDSGKENDDDNGNRDSRKKRRRILGPEFGSIDLDSEEGKKLLAAKSHHMGAVLAAEAEREEKYFNELEKKEQLEDKMKTITEIKVKVVYCKQCNYVAESASELCYKENHSLKHSKTLKKFFACKECKQRTITYGAPIPKHPCRNCGASNYQKTTMYKEKEGPKIGGETLLVRGEELPKFLNSLK